MTMQTKSDPTIIKPVAILAAMVPPLRTCERLSSPGHRARRIPNLQAEANADRYASGGFPEAFDPLLSERAQSDDRGNRTIRPCIGPVFQDIIIQVSKCFRKRSN